MKRFTKFWSRLAHVCLLLQLCCSALVLHSCNVTRVVTTEAKSYRQGDTCVNISTRTVETYDAKQNKTNPF